MTLIVAHASKHGRRPSEVFEDYLAHPQDYRLLWSFEAFRAEQERKAQEEAGG